MIGPQQVGRNRWAKGIGSASLRCHHLLSCHALALVLVAAAVVALVVCLSVLDGEPFVWPCYVRDACVFR